jgi:integrase
LQTPRSIQWAWHPFRATLNLAVKQQALAFNPATTVELPSLNNAREREARYAYLRPEEVDRLSAELPAPYDLLVLFTAYTGLRRGEVAGLDVRHVRTWTGRDGSGGVVRVERTARRSKGEWLFDEPTSKTSRRDVPLPPWLAEAMHGYLAQHPDRANLAAPLWPNRHRGGSLHGEATYQSRWEPEAFYRNVFKPALRAADLPQSVRFHDLRHTYASWLAANGERPSVVAKLLGHTSAVVTLNVYTHCWPEDLAGAVSGLQRPEPRAQAAKARLPGQSQISGTSRTSASSSMT